MKPSDLSPLFSDEDATPEEIARARRIVAWADLREFVKDYHDAMDELSDSGTGTMAIIAIKDNIVACALELFPDSSK